MKSSFVYAISLAFSDKCVWIVRLGSDVASEPRDSSRSGVQLMAKRGVRIG